MPDKRSEPRYVVDWPAEAVLDERRVAGRLINVSSSGALLALPDQSLQPGTRVIVEVQPEGEGPIPMSAEVRWRVQLGGVWGYGLLLPFGVLRSRLTDLTPIVAPRMA